MKKFILGLILSLFIPANSYAQWVPPIGIPEPSLNLFAINPPISLATSTFPTNVIGGEVVELNGSMVGRSINCMGTPDNPGWIIGGSNLNISGEVNVSGQWCIFDVLKGYKFHISGHHVMLRNSEFIGVTSDQSMTGVGGNGQSLVFFRNKIHNFGNMNAPNDQDAHGLGFSRGASYVWVLENEIWNNSGDGVNCNPYPYDDAGQLAIHHIYIGRNLLRANKQTGQWCKQSIHVIVSENQINDHHAGNSSYGQGAGFQYDTNSYWALKNNFLRNDVCFGISEGREGLANHGAAFYVANNCDGARGLSCSPNLDDPQWSCAGFYLTGFGASFVLNNSVTNSIDGLHAFRGTAIAIQGTQGQTHAYVNMPTTPMRDLATDFMNLYGLDISSITGAPPVIVPLPPTDLCPNLSGVQETIPPGYVLMGGQCVLTPPIDNRPLCTSINPIFPNRFIAILVGACRR